MFSEEYSRALDAFHAAVNRAYEAWPGSHDEPWPGWDNMSAETRAELGIPELPSPPVPEPVPPHLDPASPEFDPPRCLHPSQLSEVARVKVAAQRETVAAAEAVVTSALKADFAAWTAEPEREAEPEA
jgi:hypothetical protein